MRVDGLLVFLLVTSSCLTTCILLVYLCHSGSELVQKIAAGSAAELEFMRHLALNNTVIPVLKHGQLIYKASSPDETALVRDQAAYTRAVYVQWSHVYADLSHQVRAAANMGVKLVKREGKTVELEVLGKKESYRLLEELKFTSDRKRMSVAVMDLAVNHFSVVW